MRLFRTKSFKATRADSLQTGLKKNMSWFDLLILGLGGIIGSGIFVITGLAAAEYAGPSIMVSFLMGAIICTFTALAYSELASMLPVAGGAYSYIYVSLGEFCASLVGWAALMVFIFGGATVGVGWSGYIQGICESTGIPMPHLITHIPSQGGLINLPAFLIVLLMSALLLRGSESISKLNGALVLVKIVAIVLFLLISIPHIHLSYWEPFAPNGFQGIAAGAGFIFVAYAGFDTVATAAEECKNPNRDLPIGMIGSLLGAALLYVLVAGVLTSIVPYSSLNNSEPMAQALRANGIQFGAKLVALGALTGLSTVIIAQIYGLSRIAMVMSRDGMLPQFLTRIHPRFSTPYVSILIGGGVIALVSGFFPVHLLVQMTSMFILMVFIFVSIGVMVLRRTQPNEKRTFRCPAVYFVSSISVFFCSFLWIQLAMNNWKPFFITLFFGLLVYFMYGSRINSEHS